MVCNGKQIALTEKVFCKVCSNSACSLYALKVGSDVVVVRVLVSHCNRSSHGCSLSLFLVLFLGLSGVQFSSF